MTETVDATMSPSEFSGDKPWGEYRVLVLRELERLNSTIDEINRKIERFRNDDIAQIKTDIALLQLKAGIWGALAALVVTMGAIMLRFLK